MADYFWSVAEATTPDALPTIPGVGWLRLSGRTDRGANELKLTAVESARRPNLTLQCAIVCGASQTYPGALAGSVPMIRLKRWV